MAIHSTSENLEKALTEFQEMSSDGQHASCESTSGCSNQSMYKDVRSKMRVGNGHS